MVVRKAAQHKTYTALLQAIGNRRNSLIQKAVVAQIGVRIKRDRSKKDDTRFAQRVCRLHRNLKRRIIKRTLRPLHPVNNAPAVRVGVARVDGQ